MLFALWMACAGTEVQEDRDELLDRVEELEREVVALRQSHRGAGPFRPPAPPAR